MYITALLCFLTYFYFSLKGTVRPYVHVMSYIRDMIDILNKCLRKVHADTDILKFDVTGLCTCITHEHGLKASCCFL